MTPEQKQGTHRKALIIAAVVLITAAISGFFMGLQQTSSTIRTPSPEAGPAPAAGSATNAALPHAVAYGQMSQTNYKPNAAWKSPLDQLAAPALPPTPLAPAPTEERLKALAERSVRRAFDGAPPVVPHPIDPVAPGNCLACHAEGKKVKDRLAPKLSHAHFSNCTQCHVPMGGAYAGIPWSPELAWSENQFTGLRPATGGTRAYPNSPPTIPHSTWMRDDCRSCHGPGGLVGLRTSHPERQNCLQCHAPSAELDARPWLSFMRTPSAPPRGGKL